MDVSLSSPSSARRISLAGSRLDPRKSLPNFQKSKSRSQSEDSNDIREPQEFGTTLNSLNEINSKSFNPSKAFGYNFINYMESFINKDKIDFKMVAQSLDAGTKVYASKVDLVYDNTQKISSSLAMAVDKTNVFNDSGLMLENDELDQRHEPKKKRQRKNIKTVASNLDSLNGKLETNIEIDPLFHHLSASFDVGNVNSLLMANLKVDPIGTMLLDSNASLDFEILPEIEGKTITFPLIQPSFALQNCHICKPYSNFEFSKRDLPPEIEEVTLVSNNETENVYNSNFVDDMNDGPNTPVDHNFEDDYDNDNDFHSEVDHELAENDAGNPDPAANDESLEKILRMLPEENDRNAFFNPNFLRGTFRRLPRKRANKVPATRQRRLQKPNTPFSLDDDNPPKKMKNNPRSTDLPQKVVEKWAKTKIHIEDILYDLSFIDDILQYVFKGDAPPAANPAPNNDFDYHYHNGGDCNDGMDDGIDGMDGIEIADGEEFRNTFHDDDENNLDLNAINASGTQEQTPVNAIDIDYAKVAKKINIKKVKHGMWNVIKQLSAEKTVPENNTPEENNANTQSNLTFSGLRENLNTVLSSRLNENLSTQISFVALLHLCNEKNLKLSNTDDLADFNIDVEDVSSN